MGSAAQKIHLEPRKVGQLTLYNKLIVSGLWGVSEDLILLEIYKCDHLVVCKQNSSKNQLLNHLFMVNLTSAS